MINKICQLKILKSLTALIFIITLLFSTVTLPAYTNAQAADSQDSRIIVSLGDSFSSGEGIEPFYGQDDDISVKVHNDDWLAHRSERSWPGRLKLPSVSGTMADNRDTNWYFAASSGAKTEHLQGRQKKEVDKFLSYNDVSYLDPQIDIFDELGDEKADYVTLTLGGNDAEFTEIIKTAAIHTTYLTPGKLADKLNSVWNNFYKSEGIRDNLRKAYEKIADETNWEARIIVAGYPTLLDESGNGALFTVDEARMINESVRKFNQEIETLVNSCKASGMKICFVSVEDAFNGHEAYSSDPYLNPVYPGSKPEDLKTFLFSSNYSIHPNEKGAAAYAKCVQDKIDALEKDNGESEWPTRTTSDERDIVLVLDASGSMSGTPMDETKKASEKFINTILKEDASIGLVAYDNSAMMISDFNTNGYPLVRSVNAINAGGGTNIESGLQTACNMLQKSTAEKKIIVLMSDGVPNDGKVGDELISYADSIKNENIYIYTLGFFESLSGGEKASAQALMEGLASDGYHYEVASADDLVFFFGDIADQLNGQKYIYIRIACPVDVTVSYDGETLCSVEKDLNTRTDFGSLTFEENETEAEDSSDNRIKVLRLKEGVDYDVQIEGNGRGRMDYTIGFMDDNGEYSDLRKFSNIKITKKTVIDTVAKNSESTVLNVDEDGDGKYDLKYKATANGRGELVDYTYVIYIAIGSIALIVVLVIIFKIKKYFKQKKNI